MSHWKKNVDLNWNCNDVDWNEYESYRPPYRKELNELLFQLHELYGGKCDNAFDVGAGGGTITRFLLNKFHHVIFSDPSEEYNSRARQRFHKEADAGSISFLQRKFDEFKP